MSSNDARANNPGLQIGVARREITPANMELLTQSGMGRQEQTIGSLDPLYVEAMAIETGSRENRQAAFVATGDLRVVKRAWEFRVRDEVARRTGCDEKRVLLSSVHNHSSSPMPWDKSDAANAAWIESEEKIVRGFIEACVEAWENRRPAEIAFAEVELTQTVGENRRMRLSSGVVAQCWGSGTLCPPGQKLVGPAGPNSTHMRLLAVREVGRKKPFAVLTAYPSHTHLANLPYFSGEFPGAAKREIQRRLALQLAMYANNMGGNIDVHCVHPQSMGTMAERVQWFRGAQKILAGRFADAVVRAVKNLKRYNRPKTMAHRYWSTGDQKARADVAAPLTIVNALALGDVALVSMPGEIFIEYYLRLLKKSPMRKVLLLGYNGSDSQYIPEAIGFEMGGYEIMRGPGAPGEVTKNAGLGMAMPRALVDAGERMEARLLEELRALQAG